MLTDNALKVVAEVDVGRYGVTECTESLRADHVVVRNERAVVSLVAAFRVRPAKVSMHALGLLIPSPEFAYPLASASPASIHFSNSVKSSPSPARFSSLVAISAEFMRLRGAFLQNPITSHDT